MIARWMSGIGGVAAVVLGLALLLLVGVIFVLGASWAAVRILPWVLPVATLIALVCIFVLWPMSLFRSTAAIAALGMLWASYVLGLGLWVTALVMTLELWGVAGAIVGILFAGVGLIPVALLAALVHGEWAYFFGLIVATAAVFGVRVWAMYIAAKIESFATL